MTPALSIVIPVLNEAVALPPLFAVLEGQGGVAFEVLLCDGGSDDGTLEAAAALAGSAPFPCRLVRCGRGRGRQLNAGASAARGEWLLFLHADSAFADPRALAAGVAALEGGGAVAGRFALRFRRSVPAPSLPYAYYERKARLDRPGCTHGDQGLLLRRSFFLAVGPFDETLPVLEDTLLAEAVRRRGPWLLLPAEIWTSARRFETEGLLPRQILNALVMNAAAVGWEPFFRELPGLYRRQDRAARLRLAPFLERSGELLRALPPRERLRLWLRTGGYVRGNAWQLALALDVRRAFRSGADPAAAGTPALDLYDRWLDRLTDHPPGRLLAAFLTFAWFCLARLYCRRRAC